MESRSYHGQASLTLLPVKAEDPNFYAAFLIRAEQKAVSLVSTVDHILQTVGKDIVAAVLALLLARLRVQVCDREIPIDILLTKLVFSG